MSSTDCSPNFILVRLIFMNDFPKESSPFDFDDEQIGANESVQSGGSRTFLRWSVIVTAISFAVSLAGSVMGNNVTGDSQLESIAFTLNRFGMMAMLLGCIGIFAAFRWPMLARSFTSGNHGKKKWSPWWKLFVWNVVGLTAIVTLSLVLTLLSRGRAAYFLSAMLPVLLPLALVVGIWQQGVTRAYWLGVIVSFLFASSNSSAWITLFLGPWFANTYPPGYGYTSYGMDPYGTTAPAVIFGDANTFFLFVGLLIQLVQAQFAGLLCAGYVSLLEASRRKKARLEAIESKVSDPLQVPPALTKIDEIVPDRIG